MDGDGAVEGVMDGVPSDLAAAHRTYHMKAEAVRVDGILLSAGVVGTEGVERFADALDRGTTLASATWHYRNARIIGITSEYRLPSGGITSTTHSVTALTPEKQYTLALSPGDYITSVSGYSQDYIEALHITTNTGASLRFGPAKTENFSIPLPQRHTVQSFMGSLGEEGLRSLSAVLQPIRLWHSAKVVITSEGQHRIDHGNDRSCVGFVTAALSIARVVVRSTGKGVQGVEAELVGNAGHWRAKEGSSAGDGVWDALDFTDGEYLTTVKGHLGGAGLASLRLETNTGRGRSWGSGSAFNFAFSTRTGERINSLRLVQTGIGSDTIEIHTSHRYPGLP